MPQNFEPWCQLSIVRREKGLPFRVGAAVRPFASHCCRIEAAMAIASVICIGRASGDTLWAEAT
eukprot:2608202-Pleurochrysis_carterae.AAC.3